MSSHEHNTNMKCLETREVEEESGGGSVYRVRVSLERYFSDERARCYMSVSRGRSVRTLARRLRRAFLLPRPFALVSRGHLLPPDEPLALLRPDDPVEVIPTKSSEHLSSAAIGADGRPSSEDTPRSAACHIDTPVGDRTDGVAKPELHLAEVAIAEDVRVAVASVSESPGERRAAPADLEESKRRALDLLDEYEDQPRRRRRVRRRRRAPRGAAPDERLAADPTEKGPVMEDDGFAIEVERPATVNEGPIMEHNDPCHVTVMESRVPTPPAVVRNGAGATSPRPARLVRPLPPLPAPPAPAPAPPALYTMA